jgi:glycosyltransferase involved in cell wall biosynthesis
VADNHSNKGTMKTGIHIRYHRCETTWVALQLASWIRSQGGSCSVLALGSRGKTVHPEWDNEVVTDYTCDFKEWASKCQYVIWFYDASIADLLQAKMKGAKPVLVASWDDPVGHAELYKQAYRVVCLSPSLTERLRHELQLKNVIYAPIGMPMLESRQSITIRPDRPRVLLNLRGPRKQQLGPVMGPTLTNWFHQIQAEWTLWVPKNMLHERSWINKCIKSPHKDSTFHFVTNADWDSQRLLYGWNDITIWPTLRGGHALTAIFSLIMGAPVITFDVPPANEYITKDNGILSPCQVRYDNGRATIVPDLQRYEHCVTRLLTQHTALANLKSHTSDWTQERRKLFIAGWNEVFK